MNWQKLFDTFLTACKLLGYTLAYLYGRRNAIDEFLAKMKEEESQKKTTIIVDGDKIRAEMESLKNRIPNSWNAVERVRKTSKN